MIILFAAFVARMFNISEDDNYIVVARFLFWGMLSVIIMILCLFAMEIYVHHIKFSWIKEIYTLLSIIKAREAKTIETHEKVDQTLQKVEEKAQIIQDTVKPLIESNPADIHITVENKDNAN